MLLPLLQNNVLETGGTPAVSDGSAFLIPIIRRRLLFSTIVALFLALPASNALYG